MKMNNVICCNYGYRNDMESNLIWILHANRKFWGFRADLEQWKNDNFMY